MNTLREHRLVVLDPKVSELVALAAAVGSNCRLNFDRYFGEALHREVPLADIEAAIEIARRVRGISDQDMDSHILCTIASASAHASDGVEDNLSKGATIES